MAPTKAVISVELGAKQRAILHRQLETGHYENASEVLQDALRLLDSRYAVFDEWLLEEVRVSLADKRSVPAAVAFVSSKREWRYSPSLMADEISNASCARENSGAPGVPITAPALGSECHFI